MADFTGTLLSTGFRAKDNSAFLTDPEAQRAMDHIVKGEGGFFDCHDGWWAFGWYGQYPGSVLQLTCQTCDGEGATCSECDGEGNVEVDLTDIVQRHIHDDDICAIAVSGNEKLRYNGGTTAYVSTKGTVYVDGGAEWGTHLTRADLKGIAEKMKKLEDL